MARLIAAMSGGVDSAVATAQMVEAGHEVTAVHMILSRNPPARDDAATVAAQLGIQFQVWDFSAQFRRQVVDHFVDEYARGRTPNPCLRCNQRVKFAALIDRAAGLGFDGVVTGHYARVSRRADSTVELHRGVDAAKDQSYVLGVLSQRQLRYSYFPLGDQTKAAVRAEARARGIHLAGKPDSNDICFIPDGDTAGYLRTRLGARPGVIQTVDEQVLGEHQGCFAYTIGQRKGLRITTVAPDGRPRYVVGIDTVGNRVIVGGRQALRVVRLCGVDPTWCDHPPAAPFEATVQLRAHAKEVPAVIELGQDRVDIELTVPVHGIAPGQTAVIYSGTKVVGSTVIDSASG